MSEQRRQSDAPIADQVPPEIRNAPGIGAPPTEPGDVIGTNALQLEEAHRSFAEFHQTYVGSYIQFADTKASWTFAIASALIGYIFANDDLRKVMFLPEWRLPFVLLVVTAVLLAASAMFSLFAISPRIDKPSEETVFFIAVAKRKSADQYVRDIASMDQGRLTEARLKHSYDIACICTAKYGHLKWAFRLGIAGLISMAALAIAV